MARGPERGAGAGRVRHAALGLAVPGGNWPTLPGHLLRGREGGCSRSCDSPEFKSPDVARINSGGAPSGVQVATHGSNEGFLSDLNPCPTQAVPSRRPRVHGAPGPALEAPLTSHPPGSAAGEPHLGCGLRRGLYGPTGRLSPCSSDPTQRRRRERHTD